MYVLTMWLSLLSFGEAVNINVMEGAMEGVLRSRRSGCESLSVLASERCQGRRT